ncbi:hypothetical protein SEVIR_3G330200v4 [Setaria viridis]|uniref:Uncharacterized protein n=1 Tax=Setaria viridis TaxID=4556 RepID=A0A4U6VF35_SETVI|nr:uncharacterized protein LOC117850176 [Setaria viridis]TKW28151.1 hypothetical protein SEVIR_3G330200v2 [Setaria viridis]
MRKVCANLDREDGLDTVLEVPVPESHHEPSARGGRRRRRTVTAWVRSHMDQRHRRDGAPPSRADVQLMLGVIGAPLVPQPVEARKAMAGKDIKEEPLEVSKAKYIVEQYVAAAGGEPALSAATSMYAMGKVRMRTAKGQKAKTGMGVVNGGGEVAGGFVVWQKMPEMWCVEMVVAGGTKMSAGSDGKVAWRQTPWQQAHASRGPPRPLRRCVQGLDPKSTANLFSTATWVGEKCIDDDDCFVLRVDADPSALRARSSADVEVVRHAVWGYFSQRTGLLVRLEDSHLLRIHVHGEATETAYWETSMESSIGDYRAVDGINVAHAGRTVVSLSRFGSGADEDDGSDAARGKRTCTCMEETWSIEEVDFNIMGLSTECFLPPRDMIPACNSKPVEKEQRKKDAVAVPVNCAAGLDVIKSKNSDGGVRPAAARKALVPSATGLGWFGPAKVVAVETVDAAE